jgi:integrase
MSRRRISAIPLVVDVDGVEIHASLRRQRNKTGNFTVRWRWHGQHQEKSTGVASLEEAKRVARQIIRGEKTAVAKPNGGMPVAQFVAIQTAYHGRNARPEAGTATLKEFMGIWNSFLRVCPVKTIHEVTEQLALKYLNRLTNMSKSANCRGKKESLEILSIETIKKHIRTLAGAWNLVREGDPNRVGGLSQEELVQSNPWQAIRNNVPQAPLEDDDPVQFELDDNDLGRFLDQFKDRPVGELFLTTSLWCWGRIKEMTRMEWSWIQGDYVVIPKSIAKKGRGKIVRLPPTLLERLKAIRDPKSPYVFARWADDMKRCSPQPTRIRPFAPGRMMGQMEKLIAPAAAAIGRTEITHHALRRTAMELGEEAELRQTERTSAEKLQTTVGNKRRNYTKRLGKKAFTLADGIYKNLTTALHDYPELATRLGCEPLATLAEREAESLLGKLTPIQRQRLAKKFLEGEASSGDQGAA